MNDDGTVSVPLSWSERHAEVRAERDRLRAALESIAIPPVHIPGVSEGCEGCAGVARAALDGVDFSGPVSIALEDVDAVAERDRLRAVVDALRRHRAADARLMALEDGDEDEQRAADSKAAGYWQEVVEALAALDGTGITGEQGET